MLWVGGSGGIQCQVESGSVLEWVCCDGWQEVAVRCAAWCCINYYQWRDNGTLCDVRRGSEDPTGTEASPVKLIVLTADRTRSAVTTDICNINPSPFNPAKCLTLYSVREPTSLGSRPDK